MKMKKQGLPQTLLKLLRQHGAFFLPIPTSVLFSSAMVLRHAVMRCAPDCAGKPLGYRSTPCLSSPSDAPEVMIERIDAPIQVKQGEPFHLEIFVHSNREDRAEIRLHKNKFEVAKQTVRLEVGENRDPFLSDCNRERYADLQCDLCGNPRHPLRQ